MRQQSRQMLRAFWQHQLSDHEIQNINICTGKTKRKEKHTFFHGFSEVDHQSGDSYQTSSNNKKFWFLCWRRHLKKSKTRSHNFYKTSMEWIREGENSWGPMKRESDCTYSADAWYGSINAPTGRKCGTTLSLFLSLRMVQWFSR